MPANDFSVRWTGTIAAPKVGDYGFDIKFAHCFPCSSREAYTVYLDGKQVAEHASDESKTSHASTNQPFRFHFADTEGHDIRIDYSHHSKLFGAGITFDWQPPQGALLPSAVAAVKKADLVVAFVGLSPELEGEEMPVHVEGFAGGDRTKIDLPDAQEEMLRTVGLIGKPLVVVLLNGSAISATWAQQHAAAVVEAWYPGEAGGEAIAETLSGKNNPGGRLPVTFYASLDQLPAFTDYSMKARTYRFFKGEPLYRFGEGLGYTHFSYSGLHLSTEALKAGDKLTIEAEVSNAGKLAGDEVVEVYLTPPEATPRSEGRGAIYSLRGFERLSLDAGQSRHVRFELSPRDLSEVAADGARSVPQGEYEVAVGGGQPVHGFNGLRGFFKVIGRKELLQ